MSIDNTELLKALKLAQSPLPEKTAGGEWAEPAERDGRALDCQSEPRR